MPNKKKGKKKLSTKAAVAMPEISVAASKREETKQLDDVSCLLFGPSDGDTLPFDLPYIGPIELVDQRYSGENENQVVHGRGLIVTRDVLPGECLFVTLAIVSTPVDEVHRRFVELHNGEYSVNDTSSSGYGRELEDITESVLVEQIQTFCKERDTEDVDFMQRTFDSFVSQMSSEDVPSAELDVILADVSLHSDKNVNMELEEETIVNIIRRNAFGPDYHNYDTIADYWTKNADTIQEPAYNRLLGVYPLAAIINHSCSPNAIRIFGTIPASIKTKPLLGREVMIVHASVPMKKGTEVMWSYLPPTTPFNARHEMLESKYGFSCQCNRCVCEKKAMDGREFDQIAKQNIDDSSLPKTIQILEAAFISNSISSEAQRYLRVGYASIYMQYFNAALASPNSTESNDVLSNLLKLAMQLHFSFVSCNNASTEHLSILHLCYELASSVHTRAITFFPETTNTTISQVRFWTEQLKKAHMIRYGSLGENLETVRNVMKHSRAVLRNRGGWYAVKDKFI
jgi:hypothetical protein